MITHLKNCTIYDPAQRINGKRGDIYIANGKIIASPYSSPSGKKASGKIKGTNSNQTNPNRISKVYDLRGKIVMAGAIDIHSHIAGAKMTAAKLLLPEFAQRLDAVMDSFEVGLRYAQMGWTTVIEPAMLPANARHTHLELGMVPFVDKGAYAVLGNDAYLLELMAKRSPQGLINDYVAHTITATKALGVKVINPGAVDAFKHGASQMNLEDTHPKYQNLTPAKILQTLLRAVTELGIRHPLHLHTCNIGTPGNIDTTAQTIRLADGLPLHLTHVQFHSYGQEGKKGFSSGATQLIDLLEKHKNLTVDVGQVMFCQTVTVSGDKMHQYRGRNNASPKKWAMADLALEGGSGIVPIEYSPKSFVNSVQWALGLELFLLNKDPARMLLTTDHPNGAPFTVYPEIIRLLGDSSYRRQMLEEVANSDATKTSVLGSLKRQYSLYELATMTRHSPAKLLGLKDRGNLKVGSVADIAVYDPKPQLDKTFRKAVYVFKDGELIIRNGSPQKTSYGKTLFATTEGSLNSFKGGFKGGVTGGFTKSDKSLARILTHTSNFGEQPIEVDEFHSLDKITLTKAYEASRTR